MAQTAIISRRALENLDKTVYTPRKEILKARSLFGSHKVAPGTKMYTYQTMTARGAARVLANRGTDVPLVDADMQEASQKIITFALGANYSLDEVQQANLAGVNLDATQAAAINQGMADFEDKLVFNGNDDAGIPGMINFPGIQNFKLNTAFSDGKGNTNDPKVLLNELKDAKQQITQLTGYADVKPVLALPQAAYDALDVPYNDYQPTTLIQLLQSRGWFSQITVVNELSGADSKKDMAMIFDNSSVTAEILDAQPLTRQQTEYRNMTYTIPYSEQCGGLICRVPEAFVKVTGI